MLRAAEHDRLCPPGSQTFDDPTMLLARRLENPALSQFVEYCPVHQLEIIPLGHQRLQAVTPLQPTAIEWVEHRESGSQHAQRPESAGLGLNREGIEEVD